MFFNKDYEYVWVDNGKVRVVTYNAGWGDFKKVNNDILTFGD